MRTTQRVFGAISLLIGCTQGGGPDRPAGLSPEPEQTLVDDGEPVAQPVSGLAAFNLARDQLFTPVRQVERALPPISGGTLAVGSGGQAVLSDPDRDQVYVVDVAQKSVRTVSLTPGDEPGRVAIHDGRAYVALRAGGALVTIDIAGAKQTNRVPVCAAPRGVMFDDQGSRALMTCAGGDLVSVSADGSRVLSKLHVAPDLRDIGRDARGLWVTQYRSATLLRLDPALAPGERVAPQGANTVARTSLASGGSIDTSKPQFSPTLAARTVASQSGELFMLHQRAQADPVNPSFGGYGSGGICESGIVHTSVTRFDAQAPTVQATWPQAVVPVDLGLSPDGRFVAVVAPGNFVRQERPSTTPRDNFGFGGGFSEPEVAQQLFLARTSTLARLNPASPLGSDASDCLVNAGRWEHRFPGEAIAVQFLDAKTLLVQVRNPGELHVFRFDDKDDPRLSAVIPLSEIAARDTGHEVFHQNSGAGIACASCHGEALDDAHVWEFSGVGPRRTQHLRGGFSNNAPFHWSGDLASFDALIDDVYQRRMAAAPLAADARAALARWLDRVPLVPSEAADPAAAARGRALFASDPVGCARCHTGDALRSPGQYDVGTGAAFEVPSLHGIALRLPFMHDGCADTFEKRFEPSCGGGDKHGNTSQLSAAERADLMAYLSSL